MYKLLFKVCYYFVVRIENIKKEVYKMIFFKNENNNKQATRKEVKEAFNCYLNLLNKEDLKKLY